MDHEVAAPYFSHPQGSGELEPVMVSGAVDTKMMQQ